jgi:flagellar hook-associated protein 3 FlgL
MCAITAIPTTRLSNQFITARLLAQIQGDQRGLLQVQSQIMSGRRLNLPSDDAPAAMRGMTLQSLLERKATIASGLKTVQTYLSASESAVGTATSLLSDVRATALSVVGSNVSQAERDAAVAQLDSVMNQLLSVGNQQFKGRYVFGGSQTQAAPFTQTDNGVVYSADEADLQIYSDITELTSSNVSGNSVFGAISKSVTGAADLNPTVTANTLLSDLHGGQGVRIGSISVSDGSHTSIVSIDGARTVGDVARLLEANPPANRVVTARVTSTGLEVSLDGGNLSIDEVGSGTTAAGLGIRRPGGTGPGPVVGTDLNPQLKLTTPLSDVLGSRARAYLPNANGRNDLIIEGASSGASLNGVTIKYVNDDWFNTTVGLSAGNEFATFHPTATAASTILKFPGLPGLDNGLQLTATTAGTAFNNVQVSLNVRTTDGLGPQFTYNSTTKGYTVSVEDGTTLTQLRDAINASGGPFTAAITPLGNASYTLTTTDSNVAAGNTYLTGDDANTLAVHIDPGNTTANQVIAAIAAQGTFAARLDPSEEGSDGNGTVIDSAADPASVATTAGGAGTDFDRSGLQIQSGTRTFNIDFSKARTIEDVLNTINGAGADVVASLNSTGTGLDIRSRLSGASFSIGENGGTTAAQLGLRTFTAQTPLTSLNHGQGVRAAITGNDFTITRQDGTTFGVSLAQGGVASARIGSTGNTGLLISTVAPGTAGNQYSVRVVDSGVGGSNSVALVGNTLQYSVDVAAGFTAQNAIDLLAADPTLKTQFKSQLDKSTDVTNNGSGNLGVTTSTAFAGGQGSAVTVGDVLALINNNPANLASGPPVTARLAVTGNGIELYNTAPPSTATLSITRVAGNVSATQLGLIAADKTVSSAPTASGTTLKGGDVNPQQVDGVFTALIHLRAAIVAGDQAAVERSVDELDASTTNMTFARAELGTRMKSVEVVQNRIDEEDITLKSALSDEIDVDFTQAISDMAQRQAAFQAALQVAAQLSKSTLLDYL